MLNHDGPDGKPGLISKALQAITRRRGRRADDATALRLAMVDDLVAKQILRSEAVRDALESVPRHRFVPHVTTEAAYANTPIHTHREGEATTSCAPQPEVMTLMLQQLDVQPGHRVLEIGAGTGYNAAILSHLTGPEGRTTSVEVDPRITTDARRKLEENGYHAVNCQQADGWEGFSPDAPYDRILATVGIREIPPAWREQTTADAVIATPVQIRGFTMGAALLKRGEELVSRSTFHCSPLPIRGPHATAKGHHTVGNSPHGPKPMTIAVDEAQDPGGPIIAGLLQDETWLHAMAKPPSDMLHTINTWSGFYLFSADDPRTFVVHAPSQHADPHITGYGLEIRPESPGDWVAGYTPGQLR